MLVVASIQNHLQDQSTVHERKGIKFMRRFTTVLTGVAVAAFTPFGAFAAAPIVASSSQFTTGGITVTTPLDGTSEVAGPNTTAVTITAPAGTFTAADAVTIDVVVFMRDAAGVVQSLQVFAAVAASANSAAGDGSLGATVIDFSVSGAPQGMGTNLGVAINTARALVSSATVVTGGGPAVAFGIGIVVNDATVDGADGADTLLDLASETTDQIINADDAGPVLMEVFRDSTVGAQKLIFVFDDNISTSVLGNLTNVDFESSTTSGGTFAALVAGAFAGNPAFIASSNNRAMIFPIVVGQENLAPAVGNFVRIALAGAPAQNVDVQDLALNPTDTQAPIAIAAVNAPTIVAAKWNTFIGAGGVGALRVDFSANVNSAALGDLTFWQGAVGASIVPSAGTTDLTVTSVSAFNPLFPRSVFLLVTSAAVDSVASDGKGDITGGANPPTYSIAVDATLGTPPQDFLGTPITGTSSTTITDCIQPDVLGNPFTLDTNGDGVIDALGWNFTEPIDVSSMSAAGVTLTKLATTVHPFDLFKANLATTLDPTDAANQDTTVLDTTAPIDNTFPAASFTRQSQDTTGANRLQQNNVLVMNFDSAAVDWDEDGTVGALDVDQEATPGTFDTNFASVAIGSTTSGLTDSNAVSMGLANGSTTPAATTTSASLGDGAGAVACRVDFVTGDNGSPQRPSEQDNVVGDSATNNVASVIYNEGVVNAGVDPTAFRFGPSGAQRFQAGNLTGITGTGTNIANFIDAAGGGFGAGDTFTIASTNGLNDSNGNAYPGSSGSGAPSLTVQDGTAPYIPLVNIIVSGNPIHSAFLGGLDTAGFATTLTLTFSRDLKAGTGVTATDWTIEGVPTTPTPVLSGKTLTFTFASGLVSATSVIDVTYNAATAATADLITANGGTMASVSATNTTFKARVPTVDVSGEFMAVMDIGGTITDTDGTTAAPDGTQVFGLIGVPRIKMVSFTMGGIGMWIDDDDSMEAFTNFFLGLEDHLYLLIDNEEMSFSNLKDDPSFGTTDGIVDITLSTLSTTNVTFSGSGSTTGSSSAAGGILNIASGQATVIWDVLRSSDGTAFSLFTSGYQIGGQPIASKAIVTDGMGSYQMHMTAPLSAFNSKLNAKGWPVIVVVEHTNAKRYPVSGLLNAVDLQGPLTFAAANRLNDPFNSDGNLAFNINLQDVHNTNLFRGWNGVPNDRNSGWQSLANGIQLPGGVSNITTGTSFGNTHAFDQFVFFHDSSADGTWTSNDDSSFSTPLDSIRISFHALDNCIAFTMTDKGVKAGDDIKAFSGGYAAGIFNGDSHNIGIFMFGPAMVANTSTPNLLFFSSSPFLNNLTTLGWAFMTAPNSTTNLAGFLTDNASDFLIIFSRTGNNAVTIRTFSSSGGGDATQINRGDTIFVHKQ